MGNPKFRHLHIQTLDYNNGTQDFNAFVGLSGGTSLDTASIISVSGTTSAGTLTIENASGSFADGELLADELGGSADADGTVDYLEYEWELLNLQPAPPITQNYTKQYSRIEQRLPSGRIINSGLLKTRKVKDALWRCTANQKAELELFFKAGIVLLYPDSDLDDFIPVEWLPNTFESRQLRGGDFILSAQFVEVPYTLSPTVVVLSNIADIGLSMVVDDSNPEVSDSVVFTCTAINNGPTNAGDVEIAMPVPTGCTFSSAVPSAGSYNSSTGIWDIGSLNNGISETLALTVTVDAGQGGKTIPCIALVSLVSPQVDNVAFNDSTAAYIVVQSADLAVSLGADDTTPDEGDTIVVTSTVRNLGPNNTTNASLSTPVPSGLTYVSDNPSQGSYVSGTGAWTIGTINDAAAPTLEVTCTVDAATSGASILWSTGNVAHDQPDPVSTNDSASLRIDVTEADLDVTIGANDATPDVGQAVRFQVDIENLGPNDTTTVSITATTPSGLTFQYATQSQGSFSNPTWTVGSIANGITASLVIYATVDAGQEGNMITFSTGTVSADQGDPVAGNNSDSVTITVNT